MRSKTHFIWANYWEDAVWFNWFSRLQKKKFSSVLYHDQVYILVKCGIKSTHMLHHNIQLNYNISATATDVSFTHPSLQNISQSWVAFQNMLECPARRMEKLTVTGYFFLWVISAHSHWSSLSHQRLFYQSESAYQCIRFLYGSHYVILSWWRILHTNSYVVYDYEHCASQ